VAGSIEVPTDGMYRLFVSIYKSSSVSPNAGEAPSPGRLFLSKTQVYKYPACGIYHLKEARLLCHTGNGTGNF
jgi:hypothetical protein